MTADADATVDQIVIVGGGTAGWMTAAALATALSGGPQRITLVESEDIGIVGVGEATIPEILKFNAMLGLNEAEFLAATNGTFKYGIEFVGWSKPGQRYLHPFGPYGVSMEGIDFHHFWLKARAMDPVRAGALEQYSIVTQAALKERFSHPVDRPGHALADLRYAYHFDAVAYGQYLRRFAEGRGVTRIEGKVVNAQRLEDGGIGSILLEDGRQISGDFFVDCSGFRGLLIEQALESGYEDWREWLPCDRAIAVPCENTLGAQPYTRSTADKAGWRWRIPLQHRVGNGHVYSSAHMSDEEATALLLAGCEGKTLADPRPLQFVTGKRRRIWHHNVVAIGLSGGFLEPLESTSIHLIQSAITKLVALFPRTRNAQQERTAFNQRIDAEFVAVRDFLVLHYLANQRTGEAFWDERRAKGPTPRLAEIMELYLASGRLLPEEADIFKTSSWLAVLEGQAIAARHHHPIADALNEAEVWHRLHAIGDVIRRASDALPPHRDALAAMGAIRAPH